ncbi:hypothetical protein AB6A40_008079 [Gnathostoma spinigerum]|uniref:Uncharacterized protein n=1 Tax=Gnathostoma spinigerum TaxID=75299 RepID=A0ABD6EPA6_9BILA
MLRYIFEAMNDPSLSVLKKSHGNMMDERSEHYEYEIAIVRREQKEELEEEEEATRFALNVVQRAHEAEHKNLSEKLRHHSWHIVPWVHVKLALHWDVDMTLR